MSVISKISSYTIEEHRHRFAVWTAARAAQRGYLKTELIYEAIERFSLTEALDIINKEVKDFDEEHPNLVTGLTVELIKVIEEEYEKTAAEKFKKKTTYGRVAKIIAVYIKTVYILSEPDSALSRVAHPPIDRILLKNLEKVFSKKGFSAINWTKLEEDEYKTLIAQLRGLIGDEPFWKLEVCWKAP